MVKSTMNILNKIEFTDINKFIDKHWKVDPSYRWSLVTELIRDGLISSSIERQQKKRKGHSIIKNGRGFYKLHI